MGKNKFIVMRYAEEINRCKKSLYDLYEKYERQDRIEKIEKLLSEVSNRDKIRIVIIGQYTAGKSTIISALCNNNDILIDSDVSTEMISDYDYNGVILSDTPGLHSGNEEHDTRTVNVIKEADILIYCITSDLFNQYTKDDFIKWAFENGYVGKMILVVNKMSKEYGDYEDLVQNYSNTINKALAPHSLIEIAHSFVDAKDYKDGINENDVEMIKFSHFEEFIKLLNDFISQKGELGKLDTPIKIIKEEIDEEIYSDNNSDSDNEEFYLILRRLERLIEQKKKNASIEIRSCIHRELIPIVEKGEDLALSVGVEDINLTEKKLKSFIEEICEKLNQQLEEIIKRNIEILTNETSEVFENKRFEYFFKYVNGEVETIDLKSKQTVSPVDMKKFQTISDLVSKLGNFTSELAKGSKYINGTLYKASDVSGSWMHQAVKTALNKIGYKFKPWEATKIAKNIGNIGKVLGPLLNVLGVILEAKNIIDETRRGDKIFEEQLKVKKSFNEIANDLEKEYLDALSDFFSIYDDLIEDINKKRDEIQNMINENNTYNQNLSLIKIELNKIQTQIFSEK